MNTNNKFIQIPEIVYKSKVGSTACLVYGLIYAFSQKRGYCFARNITLQKELGISKPTIERSYRRLIENGFLEREIVKDSFGKSIRKFKPLISIEKSKVTPKGIKNNTRKGIKNDTDYSINSYNKKNKSIDRFSFKSDFEKEIMDYLIMMIECFNKRHLKESKFKIDDGERKYDNLLFNTFIDYVGEERFNSMTKINDMFFIYLGHFYAHLKKKINKKSDRYYPNRFKYFELMGVNFANSQVKDFNLIEFKEELFGNDDFDPDANSIYNWMYINE